MVRSLCTDSTCHLRPFPARSSARARGVLRKAQGRPQALGNCAKAPLLCFFLFLLFSLTRPYASIWTFEASRRRRPALELFSTHAYVNVFTDYLSRRAAGRRGTYVEVSIMACAQFART